MYLEGVMVCVNYGDFLAHTLPLNKTQFNNLVVVTDTKDEHTKSICEYHNVRCIQTDVFYEGGDTFNKGKGINEGLKLLERKDWVLHLDADVVLPPMTKGILDRLPLDTSTLYGADRLMCNSYEQWQQFVENPKLHEGWIYVHMSAFPVGVRIAEYMSGGYEPIGYFQLWHPKGSYVDLYPIQHGKADRTDVLHAKQFPRIKRQLLPEIVVIHLDSEELPKMGKNWNGRKTLPFTYDFTAKQHCQKIKKEYCPDCPKDPIITKEILLYLFCITLLLSILFFLENAGKLH